MPQQRVMPLRAHSKTVSCHPPLPRCATVYVHLTLQCLGEEAIDLWCDLLSNAPYFVTCLSTRQMSHLAPLQSNIWHMLAVEIDNTCLLSTSVYWPTNNCFWWLMWANVNESECLQQRELIKLCLFSEQKLSCVTARPNKKANYIGKDSVQTSCIPFSRAMVHGPVNTDQLTLSVLFLL